MEGKNEKKYDWEHLTLKVALKDEDLAFLFREFMHEMRSAENLSFWLEAEKWKEICDRGDHEEAQNAAEEIVVKYLGDIEIGPATYGEVNLDDFMKEKIIDAVHTEACSREEHNEGKPLPRSLFDESQAWIFSMMEDDSFRKFLQSSKFKEFKENGGKLLESDEAKRKEKNDQKQEKKKHSGFRALLLRRAKKKETTAASTKPPSPHASSAYPHVRLADAALRTPSMLMLSDYVKTHQHNH